MERMVENPLQNNLIMRNIFTKLSLQHQKEFRLVSTEWLDYTLASWRKESLVILDFKKDKNCIQRFVEKCDSHNPKGFLKIQEHPFRRFRVEGANILAKHFLKKGTNEEDGCSTAANFTTEPTENKNDSAWTEFWYLWSTSITFLRLCCCSFGGKDHLQIIKSILEKSCPNLKELEIINPTFPEAGDYLSVWDAVEEEVNANPLEINSSLTKCVVAAAAKLESFTLGRMQKEINAPSMLTIKEAQTLLKLMPNVKKLNLGSTSFSIVHALSKSLTGENNSLINLIKLDHITLEFYSYMLVRKHPSDLAVFKSLLEYFRTSQHPLKFLEVRGEMIVIRDPSFHFQEFLQTSKDSLETLIFTGMKIESDLVEESLSYFTFNDFNNVSLPKLTKLDLSFEENCFKGECLFKFDFNSLGNMPNLKVFRCRSQIKGDRNSQKMRLNQAVTQIQLERGREIFLPDLQEFHFSLYPKLDTDFLMMLGKWAKNLKKLEMVFTEEVFCLVFYLWSNLECVTLLKGSSVEEETISQVRESRRKYATIINVDTLEIENTINAPSAPALPDLMVSMLGVIFSRLISSDEDIVDE